MDFHPHETRILKALDKKSSPEKVSKKTGLKKDAVMRASSWLNTKGLVEIEETLDEAITLGPEGAEYAEKGLPERQLLEKIGGGMPMKELKDEVDKQTFNIGFGWLRRKAMVSVDSGVVKPLNTNRTLDEKLLEKISNEKTVKSSSLDPGQLKALSDLKSRQSVVEASEEKTIILNPTKEGLKIGKSIEVDERIGELTPQIIKSGKWREQGFRPYQVDVYREPENPVRIHPLSREIRRIRSIFTHMGFSEISGPLIESAFWNFDALFQPQDHPARDMHDTFYLDKTGGLSLEGFEEYSPKVAGVHEDGGDTGSTGWGYKWSPQTGMKNLLRTHTTAVTARKLGEMTEDDMPLKVFSIGKVFRNETVDYKHLPEFYQVEGIVVDPDVNFRHLLGILKEFYDQMGFDKVRFSPDYFPYTEMSVEPAVWFEERQEWIELGGAGIFRPEVVKPLLGIDVPVLAWGLGLDRVVSLKMGLKDIRQLYISDLDWLKTH